MFDTEPASERSLLSAVSSPASVDEVIEDGYVHLKDGKIAAVGLGGPVRPSGVEDDRRR